jgi:hypothetical protein
MARIVRVEIYPSGRPKPGAKQRYRWRRIAGNGQKVTNPGQSFASAWSAERSAKRTNPDAVIERL